jgi:hypothetical protein
MKRQLTLFLLFLPVGFGGSIPFVQGNPLPEPEEPSPPQPTHKELPNQPYPGAPSQGEYVVAPAQQWVRDGYVSVQVNVDESGNNLFGDAANEPSMAIDPTNGNRIVIGWRQFDTIASSFRQSGVGYSHDGGATWTFAGVIEPGIFGSDPVVAADADGNFYYVKINGQEMSLFRSYDGGMTWPTEEKSVILPNFHDKEWMAIDQTDGIGQGNIYLAWTDPEQFTRSTDGGDTWMSPIPLPLGDTLWGTLAVNPDGVLFIIDRDFVVARSTNAKDPYQTPTFELVGQVDIGGTISAFGGVNPVGLHGQPWIAADHSDGPSRCNLYVLCSVDPPGSDPLDVRFSRSTDGGFTWSESIRINDDLVGNNAWQWFGAMSVAPNGRIDVFWFDTRNDPTAQNSEVFYSYSTDGGLTWVPNIVVSPSFDHSLGYPQQHKIGDYTQCVSDNIGVGLPCHVQWGRGHLLPSYRLP